MPQFWKFLLLCDLVSMHSIVFQVDKCAAFAPPSVDLSSLEKQLLITAHAEPLIQTTDQLTSNTGRS